MIAILIIAAVVYLAFHAGHGARQLPARPRPRPPRHQPVLVIGPRPVGQHPRPVRHPHRAPPLTPKGENPCAKS